MPRLKRREPLLLIRRGEPKHIQPAVCLALVVRRVVVPLANAGWPVWFGRISISQLFGGAIPAVIDLTGRKTSHTIVASAQQP